jgi:hypothetical protein
MSVIHLYRIPQVVELTTGTGATLMNYPANRTDFRVYRHVDNEIDFFLKNIDRRAVTLVEGAVTIHILDQTTKRVLLTRNLQIVSAPDGHARLFMTGDDVAKFPSQTLRYTVVQTRSDGVQVACYTDRDRKAIGLVEVAEGPIPGPAEPTPISTDDFINLSGKLQSGAYPGSASVGNVSGQHSLVIPTQYFTGRVTIQGSLIEQPGSSPGEWFNVTSREFTNSTELVHMPFEGNLLWVRFIVETVSGDIDVIQYRN